MDGIEELQRTYKERADQYRSAVVRLALVRRDGALQLYNGTVQFTHDRAGEDRRDDYGSLVLVQMALPPEEVLRELEEFAQGRPPLRLGFAVPTPPRFRKSNNPYAPKMTLPLGSERLSPWPAQAFALCYDTSQVQVPMGPLSTLTLPLIVDPRTYVMSWLGFSDGRWSAEVHNGGLLVILPDFRACIRRVVFREDSATVEVETQLVKPSQLTTRATLGDGQDRQAEATVVRTEAGFAVPFAHFPQSFYFFLMDKDTGEVLDWARVYPSWGREALPSVVFALPGKQLARLLDEGENETVEFKREPTPTIVQSIIAFANTKGGVILVGVEDSGRPVGTDTKAVEDKVREWVERNCDPPVQVKFEGVEFDGAKVCVIRVPIGPNPPYVHRENGAVYVRRGSTDRPARRAEMDDLYNNHRNGVGLPGGKPW